ncbi:MAG: hypothetical protein J7L15_06165 [Clostridiales bacterium]|nr:hypothetical protein [Clostridiales bacterium]
MFNLNTSRKPERELQGRQIDEVINMFGIACKYLYTEKINVDLNVFRDFSHLRVGEQYEDVMLLPEDTSNFEGDVSYNMFGFHNQWTQQLFISRKGMLKLFPDFMETGRHELVNSLIVTPAGTLLEITHVESFTVGVSNTWAYADLPNSYKLSVKIYDHNLPDEGITSVKTTVDLEEGKDGEIFKHIEDIDTSDIDAFFDTLEISKDNIEEESIKGTKEGTGKNNTNNPFGSLS